MSVLNLDLLLPGGAVQVRFGFLPGKFVVENLELPWMDAVLIVYGTPWIG